jgi:hypothetical protein
MIRHKARRSVLLGAVLAALLAFGAAAAYAHTAQITIYDGTLVYQQLPGIDVNYNNDVTIALKTDSLGSYYEVDDPGSTGMFFPAQCTPLDPAQEDVRCPATGIDELYVRTGTGEPELKTTTDSITILAPTPAILSSGSVTNAGGPRTSDITAGPVGGDVLYSNPGSGTLNAKNGSPDTIHSCPGNTVIADPSDTVIPDCASAPNPPAPPAPSPLAPPPSPGSSPTPSPGTGLTPSPTATATPSTAIAITYKQRQRILKRRALILSLSIAMPMTVKVRGTIALHVHRAVLRLADARVRVRAVTPAITLRLRVPRRKLKALRRAFAKHRRLYANVQVNASDPASATSFALARRVALVR